MGLVKVVHVTDEEVLDLLPFVSIPPHDVGRACERADESFAALFDAF